LLRFFYLFIYFIYANLQSHDSSEIILICWFGAQVTFLLL